MCLRFQGITPKVLGCGSLRFKKGVIIQRAPWAAPRRPQAFLWVRRERCRSAAPRWGRIQRTGTAPAMAIASSRSRGLDQQEAAEILLGLDVGTVGDGHLALASAHGDGGLRRLQRLRRQQVAGGRQRPVVGESMPGRGLPSRPAEGRRSPCRRATPCRGTSSSCPFALACCRASTTVGGQANRHAGGPLFFLRFCRSAVPPFDEAREARRFRASGGRDDEVTWRLAEAGRGAGNARGPATRNGELDQGGGAALFMRGWLPAASSGGPAGCLPGSTTVMLDDIGIRRAEIGPDAGDLRGIADVLALLTVDGPPSVARLCRPRSGGASCCAAPSGALR